MQKTVYYLVHKDSEERVRYYKTRAGARIAQRARNSHLGFQDRIERVCIGDNWEAEQCQLANGTVETATYVIIEDTVDTEDLTVGSLSQSEDDS